MCLIDRYAILAFLNRLLTSKNYKTQAEFNTRLFEIDFGDLGLNTEAISCLGNSPSISELKEYESQIVRLAEISASYVFGGLTDISQEDKECIKLHADGKIATYIGLHNAEQDSYLEIIMEIDKASKEGNNEQIRLLSKAAKFCYNRMAQYSNICQNYSNVSSYLNGMIRHKKPSK